MINRQIVFEHLHLILLFGVIALIAHWIAKGKGFFSLTPRQEGDHQEPLRGNEVIIAFAIYLSVSLIIAPLVGRLFAPKTVDASLAAAGFLQLFSMGIILSGLILFALKRNRGLMRSIWVQGKITKERLIFDFSLGVVTWLIAFPLVVTIAQMSDLLLYLFLGVESYEQVAVRFLKMALESPLLLTAALTTVLCAAPVIEEWLFRGFLQTFFRKHLGTKAAILLSSLCFSLFHLSISQGWGNVSLALSLFAFAWYLGFIYERQKSLIASIGLHMTFNAVSAFRILFGPEG